jgi:uncharacterized membrane protein YfcA
LSTSLLVVAVLFVATLIRSAFGFGEALVAVPVLALFMPVGVAAPLAVLVSITVAAIVVIEDWRSIHLGSAAWLVLTTLAGVPLGLLLLTSATEQTVKALLGIVIVAFSAYSLGHSRRFALHDNRLAWLFGLAAGVLGGAYGMNGPPLVMFGTLRRWSPVQFRATLQGYFLPASIVVMAGYWATGFWVPSVTHYYVVALPATLVAIALGRALNRRLNAASFLTYVHVMLVVIGLALLAQAVRAAHSGAS